MTRSYDIAEFNLADGVTPRVADKLNLNFRRLVSMMVNEEAGSGRTITDLDLPLSTASGGTGRSGFPENSLLVGNGANPLSYIESEQGYLYCSDDGDLPYWDTPSIEEVQLVGDNTFPELGIFIEPEEQYPASDKYALTNIEITNLWNAAQS